MSEDLANDIKDAVSVINDPHIPTNPGCMSITRIAADAKIRAENVEGIEKVKIIVEGHAMADSINEMINR